MLLQILLFFHFYFNCLLQIYRNAVEFYILTLYSANLLSLFTIYSSIFVECLGFTAQTIMLSINKSGFTSFLVYMNFTSFSCLIALSRISNIMLHRGSESEYPCLFYSLKEKNIHH